MSTTRDDRSVGLRRRGKRKAAAAAKELLLIFPYPLAFAKTRNAAVEREERGGKKSLARIIHTNP